MTHTEYERHPIGQLCWNGQAATQASSARQRQCPRCRRTWSYATRRLYGELLQAFGLRATAHPAARSRPCHYATAFAAYRRSRAALVQMADEENRKLLGELELDESYFGGKRKGQRGRGATGKVAVFGIRERAGRVFAVAVADCKKETWMAKVRAATVKGSVLTPMSSPATTMSKVMASTCRSTTRRRSGRGRRIATGRLYRHVRGVDPENLPLYLAE